MAWPNTPFRTMIDGTTFWDAALAAALQSAINNITNRQQSLAGLLIDNAGGTALSARAADEPLALVKDSGGNRRFLVDHNGLPTGAGISQFHEEWAWTTDPAGPPQTHAIWTSTRWFYDLATAGAINMQTPSASYDARFLKLTPTTAFSATALWGPQLFLCNNANQSVVLETEVGLNTAGAGITGGVDFSIGFQDGTDDPFTCQNSVYLRKLNNSANWGLISIKAGSLASSTVTSTPPTAGTFPTDRIRIEIQGSSSPYGAYQARFFVNEVLLGTIVAANMPGAFSMCPVVSFNTASAPTGSPLAYIGPLTVTWNRFLTGPNL